MKRLHNILAVLIICAIGIFSFSAGVIHVCSEYCLSKDCTEVYDCCKHASSNDFHLERNNISVNDCFCYNDCSCLNIKYDIRCLIVKSWHNFDFIPKIIFIDNTGSLSDCINPVISDFIYTKRSNAPPILSGKDILLACSVLLI